MRKPILAIALILLMGVLAPFARAVEPTEGPGSMARYYGEDVDMFVSFRVDAGYVETLNALTNRVLGNIPAELNLPVPPSLDLNALLQGAFATAPFTLEEVRSFLGDYVSVGVQDYGAIMTGDQQAAGFLIGLELSDTNGFTDFLEANIPGGLPSAVEAGNFSVYEIGDGAFLAVAPDIALVSSTLDVLPAVFTGLEASTGYTSAISALPADSYNIVAYLNYQSLFNSVPGFDELYTPEMLAMLPNHFGMGATVLDGSVLTIDAAMDLPTEGMADFYTTPLNADFARFIPNDTDLLVHGRDLNSVFDYALTSLTTQMEAMGGMGMGGMGSGDMDFEAQLEQAFTQIKQATNIDIREDVLAWMTTDYAIFTSVGIEDVLAILESTMGSAAMPDIAQLPVEFGFVIGTSDADKTAETVTKISTLLKAAVANQEEVTITDINGELNGIEIAVTAPINGTDATTGITVLLASNNNVFYFGTKGAADAVIAGDTLLNDPVYAKALTYAIPNQAQFLYTDDEGLTEIAGLFAVALVGTSPRLDSESAAFEQLTGIITALNAVFDHSIISYGLVDDMVLVRATIAFK